MEMFINFFKKKDGTWNKPKIVVFSIAAAMILLGIAQKLIGG